VIFNLNAFGTVRINNNHVELRHRDGSQIKLKMFIGA